MRCPIVDMIGILNRLEGLAGVRYCWMCFRIGSACQCSAAPHQVSGPMATLWAPPSLSYAAMVSSTETTASTSTAGATSSSHSLPQDPLGEPMDTSLPLTTENLLVTTSIGWGRRPWVPLNRPTAPGLRQMRPQTPQQPASTTGEPGTRLATPYQQQVFPPKRPALTSSAASSTSRDQEGPTEEAESTRGRSSSPGPQERQRRSKSVARGSKKRRRADPNDSLIEKMANFVASGWRRDLTHFIGCCWAAQGGSLEQDEWHAAITKFLSIMAKKKNYEWMDIKELTPLRFMPYVAKLFREVTGRNLQGLSHFTGWIGVGGYYHWRVVQQGLDHHVPHLAGQPAPRTPDTRPSGKPLPVNLPSTEAPSTGASGQQPGRSQPTPSGGRQDPTLGQSRMATAPKQGGKHPLPTRVINQPPRVRTSPPGLQEVLPTTPRVEEGQVMVPVWIGTRCTCARPRGG